MRATHEHEFEAQTGLPEKLPQGEVILWQGSPNWVSLAVEAFHLRALGIYFSIMLLLQASYLTAESEEFNLSQLLLTTTMILLTLSAIALWAWMSANASMYTITNKRVVIRLGIVFSLTFNFPLKKIIAANELHRKNGTTDLSLILHQEDHIAWLHLWPHVRPWEINHPEPTLRCIRNGVVCGEILKSAWLHINRDDKRQNQDSHELMSKRHSQQNSSEIQSSHQNPLMTSGILS
jgi:hypothetical protein